MSKGSNILLKKSKANAKTQNHQFEPSVMYRAKKLVSRYKIIIEKKDRRVYMGTSVEIPTTFADGNTPEKCYKATLKGLSIAAATMIESGHNPPQPSSPEKRTTQINIRLTPQERLWLSSATGKLGYKGISDFVRNVALKAVHKNNPL